PYTTLFRSAMPRAACPRETFVTEQKTQTRARARVCVFCSVTKNADAGARTPRGMRPLIHEIDSRHSPESLVEQLRREHGVVLLRSGFFDSPQARFSFIAARPFLTFCSFGSRCELHSRQNSHVQFGNPWHLLDGL